MGSLNATLHLHNAPAPGFAPSPTHKKSPGRVGSGQGFTTWDYSVRLSGMGVRRHASIGNSKLEIRELAKAHMASAQARGYVSSRALTALRRPGSLGGGVGLLEPPLNLGEKLKL
jgi:hypothetical protein